MKIDSLELLDKLIKNKLLLINKEINELGEDNLVIENADCSKCNVKLKVHKDQINRDVSMVCPICNSFIPYIINGECIL